MATLHNRSKRNRSGNATAHKNRFKTFILFEEKNNIQNYLLTEKIYIAEDIAECMQISNMRT